jgi:hypothetical protein
MKSVLLIDDSEYSLEDYLTPLIDEFEFNIDSVQYSSLQENADVERFSTLFIYITDDNQEKILKFLSGIRSTRTVLVTAGPLNDYQEFLTKVSKFLSGAIWSTEWPLAAMSMTLRLIDQSIDRDDLEFLNAELAALQDQFSTELDKTKRLHLEMIPKRYQRYKGMNVFTKYVVGEQGGGEFFDFAQNSSQTLIFMCQADSYMGTSLAMMSFAEFKHAQEFEKADLAAFLKELRAKMIEEKLQDKRLLVFLYLYNHGSQEVQGYALGEYDIVGDKIGSFSSNSNCLLSGDIENSEFSMKLEHGSNQVILSPGYRANFDTLDDYYEALKKIRSLNIDEPSSKLNEIFMLVPEAGNSKFFKKDITSLIIEVESNAIFKI